MGGTQIGEARIDTAAERPRRSSRQNAEIATVAGLMGGLLATLVRRGVISREDVAGLFAHERRDMLPLHQPHAARMVDVVEFLTMLTLARGARAEARDAGALPPAPSTPPGAVHDQPGS